MVHKRSMGLGGIGNLSLVAPVKSGMVPGFEPISYLERLRKVLDALHSSRQNVRESELTAPVFPDSVGQFGIVHHFRYAILPPLGGGSVSHLLLNVTYDGGWEPYMRVIHRDLGPLLDLLFCHCDGYPISTANTFETYCRWVRGSEVEGGLFYADSAMPLGDHEYLAAVERAQRDGQGDGALARLAVPSAAARMREALSRARANPVAALVLPLRALKGLYRLSVYFPAGAEAKVLHTFAHYALEGPTTLILELEHLPSGHPGHDLWQRARHAVEDELRWLDIKAASSAAQGPPAAFDPATVQSHLRSSQEAMTHGCIVLMKIKDAVAARQFLQRLAPRCAAAPTHDVGCTVSFTYAGLAALGVHTSRLDLLPQEFVDGMEARCAILGDVRGNHPDRWRRPLADGGHHEIDMRVVHVVLHLRIRDTAGASHSLHPTLSAEIETIKKGAGGLQVLAVQAMWSIRNAANQTTGHFGFVDGVSQPRSSLETGSEAEANKVSLGELVIGRENDRGDAINPAMDKLQLHGSFLVLRKLRQRVDHLDELFGHDPARRDDGLARIIGRRPDGKPLVPTRQGGIDDFDYQDRPAAEACPYHAHIRRANPRDGRDYTPRILRRGMSYGPLSALDRTTERGTVFMAYCASIAEQFETIQRWLVGGSSSGVGSSQPDALLRVPHARQHDTFRYVDERGHVQRIALQDKPLVELQWGLYLFVPSVVALRKLDTFTKPTKQVGAQARTRAAPLRLPGKEATLEDWRSLLEDDERSEAAWAQLRASGVQQTAYGRLTGRYADVRDVLQGKTSDSVCGYAKRMHASVGLNLLGLDPGAQRNQHAGLGTAIASITEAAAFEATMPVVTQFLKALVPLPEGNRRPIDLVSLCDHVMAALCTHWIGLPDGKHMVQGGRQDVAPQPPRCPGNLATASRYIFTPHPRKEVEDAGQKQGSDVLKAVEAWLADKPKLGVLAEAITRTNAASVLALSLSGVLLAFPPTVQGNFLRVMEDWIKQETLWVHQNTLRAATAEHTLDHTIARDALRNALATAMRRRPVPGMLWRTPVGKSGPEEDPSDRVILSIASALRDGGPDELVFGRDHDHPTIHGCPGYDMAMGVLLGMLAGLLSAGTLRPTGSPVLLILTPG